MNEFYLYKNDKTIFQEHNQNDKEGYDEKATKERTIVGSQAKTKRIKWKKRKYGTKNTLCDSQKEVCTETESTSPDELSDKAQDNFYYESLISKLGKALFDSEKNITKLKAKVKRVKNEKDLWEEKCKHLEQNFYERETSSTSTEEITSKVKRKKKINE